MERLQELGNKLRHLRARIAGHQLRQDVEYKAGEFDLAKFHKRTADALCVSLVDLLNEIDATK